MRTPLSNTPEYAKTIIRGSEYSILKLVTDDHSGVVCFDKFTQDTWIEPAEAAIVPNPAVEN